MSEPAERYVRLALRLARHDDGVVDSYCGPPELADRVAAEPVAAPEDLVAETDHLLEGLDDSWLRDQVLALRSVAGRLAGEDQSYVDEVEACFGVRPERTPEAVLADAFEELDTLLPGSGSLRDRRREWERSIEVPADRVGTLMAAVVAEARDRTRELVGLPDGEDLQIQYVGDVAWLGYHEYLGDLRGVISFNTERPRSAIELLHLALHESYPGHHAERCLKEIGLVRGRDLLEESIVVGPSPQSLVSEGTAELAHEMVLDGEAGSGFEQIVRDSGIDLDLTRARAVERALAPLNDQQVDAALIIHQEGRPTAEARAHLVRWSLVDEHTADHAIRFVTDPASRTYPICYPAGLQRCRAYVGDEPERRWSRFRTLLTEQVRVRDLSTPL